MEFGGVAVDVPEVFREVALDLDVFRKCAASDCRHFLDQMAQWDGTVLLPRSARESQHLLQQGCAAASAAFDGFEDLLTISIIVSTLAKHVRADDNRD